MEDSDDNRVFRSQPRKTKMKGNRNLDESTVLVCELGLTSTNCFTPWNKTQISICRLLGLLDYHSAI